MQIRTEARLRFGGRLGLQQLGFEDRRQIPVRLQLARAAHFLEGEGIVIGRGRSLRNRKMRLRERWVPGGEFSYDREVARLVRVRREKAVDLHEPVGGRHVGAGEQLDQVGFGFLDAARADEQPAHGLQREHRPRLGFIPDPRRFERKIGQPRVIRHLGRAARNARIARALCEVDVGLGRVAAAIALGGDLRHKQAEKDRFGQVLQRKRRVVFLGRGGAGGRRRIVVIVVIVFRIRLRQRCRSEGERKRRKTQPQGGCRRTENPEEFWK